MANDVSAPPSYASSPSGGLLAGARRRWPLLLISALALLALWAAYFRLSQTFPTDSDGASNALQAWQMLHGNLLLSGWNVADVPYYTTELPQYMLVELVHGLSAGDVHIAAAMTYTLVILLAALLAKGKTTGWVAVLAVCIPAGIMLAPQLADGILVLLGPPDHLGTTVPIMLTWLVMDRVRPRWAVPVVVSLLLCWGAMADALVEYIAIAPLILLCAVRVIRATVTGKDADGMPRRYYVALAAGAGAAAAAADLVVLRLIPALGGFSSSAPQSRVAPLSHIVDHNLPVVGHGLLLLYGADFLDYHGSFLVLHLAGVALAALGVLFALWGFLRDRDFVSQLLLAGIAINVVIFLASLSVSWLPTVREMDAVLPLSAALAGRELAPRIAALARPAAITLSAVLAVVGVGYTAGLVHEITSPIPPTPAQRLATWLSAHDLHDGLSGYWEANVTTLTSGGQVRIRLVEISRTIVSRDGVTGRKLREGYREDDGAWYNPAANAPADFVVLSPGYAPFPGFTARADVVATFGKPQESYSVDGFTVLVWPHANLLTELGPPFV
ncbi:MAG: hypothetical protein ACRDN0_29310 [Trebonia sp.]